MKRSLTVLGVAVALAATCWIGSAQSQDKQAKTKPVIFGSADDAQFNEAIPGVSRAVLWGNPDKGPYGAFTKFVPKFDAGMHTHSNDVWLVVIKGAYLYKDSAGEKRVSPGSFIRIPAKTKHWSGGRRKGRRAFLRGIVRQIRPGPSKVEDNIIITPPPGSATSVTVAL
jgi:mannose-6-phosphate isomerase-like protein (cupin superfamily)